ncbi:MAG TPA: MFS transporter [Candidatus Bathyarchaeia archaeon]
MEKTNQKTANKTRKNAYSAIILLGIVSLMGDVVYEGSRGIIPSYLEFLGASALIVGLIGGLDLLAYVARLATGFLADKTKAYWLFIFIGYGLIVSIPLLGIATGFGMIILLISLERLGKAFRSPARDTVLSIISKDVGAGKAFGLHEFMDQLGAMIGPLLVGGLMFYSLSNYGYTFSFLLLPFLMLLGALFFTYRKISSRTIIEPTITQEKNRKLERPFYIYTLAVLLNTVGLVQYTLILFKASRILEPLNLNWIVPLIYLLIQGVDAPTALISGYAYDKFGIRILIIPFVLSIFPSLLTMFNSDLTILIVASAIFGLVLGMQESIYRAAVSELTPISSRGTAYGIFNTAYGVGLALSGAIYGLFIDYNSPLSAVVFYALALQIVATILLLNACSKLKRQSENL